MTHGLICATNTEFGRCFYREELRGFIVAGSVISTVGYKFRPWGSHLRCTTHPGCSMVSYNNVLLARTPFKVVISGKYKNLNKITKN